jgi:hypothetical protein
MTLQLRGIATAYSTRRLSAVFNPDERKRHHFFPGQPTGAPAFWADHVRAYLARTLGYRFRSVMTANCKPCPTLAHVTITQIFSHSFLWRSRLENVGTESMSRDKAQRRNGTQARVKGFSLAAPLAARPQGPYFTTRGSVGGGCSVREFTSRITGSRSADVLCSMLFRQVERMMVSHLESWNMQWPAVLLLRFLFTVSVSSCPLWAASCSAEIAN